MNKIIEVAASASATLLAAFLGAWFAFRLHSSGEYTKERNQNIQSANLSLSLLAAQVYQLTSMYAHLVPDGLAENTRHYVIKPIVPDNNIEFLSLDFNRLGFVLQAEPTLVSSLSSIQRDINTAVGLVKSRSQLHIDHLQPAVEIIQAQHGGEKVPDNFVELVKTQLGFRRDFELKDATDRMIHGLTHGRDSALSGFNMLKKATLRAYPEAKLVPDPAR